MLDSTVSEKRNTSCMVRPTLRRSFLRSHFRTSTPSMETLPSVTSTKRSMTLTRVDLPQPVGPMMPMTLPGSMCMFTSSSTRVLP